MYGVYDINLNYFFNKILIKKCLLKLLLYSLQFLKKLPTITYTNLNKLLYENILQITIYIEIIVI